MTALTLDDVLASPSLPTLPKVAMDVLDLTRDPDVSMAEIANAVRYDPALAARILKTVNSSYYGLSKPCPTIPRAIGLLGIEAIKTLVLGFSLADVTGGQALAGVDLRDYWRRSIHGAAAARRIAEACAGIDPDEAFAAALLQDIGMLALHTATRSYDEIIGDATCHSVLPEVESRTLAFTHADAGARLAEKWRLPARLIEPIRNHHPSDSVSSGDALTDVVRLAYRVAELGDAAVEGRLDDVWSVGAAIFELTAEQTSAIVQRTAEDARELSSLLSVDMAGCRDLARLLAEAEDARIAHSIAVQRRAEQLKAANERLRSESETDRLTGTRNRGWFDRTLAERFDAARTMHGTCGLLFIDADRFKSMNDTNGHQAGDAVLVELGRRLRETVGESGDVCRYGGEEFAVILPGRDLAACTLVAEALRLAIAERPFDLRGTGADRDEAPVTVSVGVAAYDPAARSLFQAPEELLKAADRAVYAAKQGGRNCVRVLRPRSAAA